ncbi:hypothetical protein AJ79_08452 [Helicocarpus griseus UAMH5409]|uniref:Uncharacterized protein n=1 Tax=Helicocarpus griseus UAMH5409 TaxID=1447875 RepID=A0A2B7WSW3_9EURO|nr:hypothetical protein AJ79_08452 [Helicocarpus griseus UAMH5409]
MAMESPNRALEGIYASFQSSSHSAPQRSQDPLSCQPVMNQALGLTHLPGSQLQQTHPVCSEKTSVSQVEDRPSVSPSATSETRSREQTPDNLFSGEGTPFDLQWANHFMESPYPEDALASYIEEQNRSQSTNNPPETEPFQEEKLGSSIATSAESHAIMSPVTGDQGDSSPRKRPLDGVESARSDIGNLAHPAKRRQTTPSLSKITSDHHEYQHGASANLPDFPPEFQLPDFSDIPDFPSSFQLPDGFDYNTLDIAQRADNGSVPDSPSCLSSFLGSSTKTPNYENTGLNEGHSIAESAYHSENTPVDNTDSETTTTTTRPSHHSSLTSSSSNDDDANDNDKTDSTSNTLDVSHFERESSVDSLFGDVASPLAAPQVTVNHETSWAYPRHEKTPTENETAPVEFVENDITKNFHLKRDDILASQYREIFSYIPKPSRYVSPYPKRSGPLGYFPSAPAAHPRYIEVAPEDMAQRLEECRQKLLQVSSERSKYKAVWSEWKEADPVSGKNKEQKLKEEPFRLKRALLAQEKKTEDCRKEAEHWQSQFRNLAMSYNGLVQHLNTLQSAHFSQHSTPVPPGNPTPVPSPQPAPVTIDLTDDGSANRTADNQASAPPNPEETSMSQEAEQLRNAMRRKEYHWLHKSQKAPRLLPMTAIPNLGQGRRALANPLSTGSLNSTSRGTGSPSTVSSVSSTMSRHPSQAQD